MKNKSKNDSCLHEEAVKWLREIAYRKINGNTNLMELLAYGGTSLWWYLDLPLYYGIKNFLREQKSTFSVSGNTINRYLDAVLLLLISLIGVLHLLIKMSLRFIYGTILNLIAPKNRKGRYTVLVPSSSLGWRESNILGKSKKRDEMVGNITKELLSRDFRVVACDICEHFPRFGIKQLVEKNISEGKLWRPLETYLTIGVLLKSFVSWIYYRENCERL